MPAASRSIWQPLLEAYSGVPVGDAQWVLPGKNQSTEDFQASVAAAEAWEFVGKIRIIEIHEENLTGRRLIGGVRIFRVK